MGLVLDKSKGLVLGSELVANGTFATDSGWTKDAGWTITGGTAVATSATNGTSVYQPSTAQTNKWYEVRFTISGFTGGAAYFTFYDGGTSPDVTSNGTYVFKVLKTGVFAFHGLAARGTCSFSVDNISIK